MSKIEWTDITSNPIKPLIDGKPKGNYCVKISEGCANCYAAKINNSPYFGGNKLPYGMYPIQKGLSIQFQLSYLAQSTNHGKKAVA